MYKFEWVKKLCDIVYQICALIDFRKKYMYLCVILSSQKMLFF
jgi:hypothetical protein